MSIKLPNPDFGFFYGYDNHTLRPSFYPKIPLQNIPPPKPVAPPTPTAPVDPMDVKYDGVPLRMLLEWDQARRREQSVKVPGLFKMAFDRGFTPMQKAALSAHWSAELKKRTDAVKAKERNRVICDSGDIDEDL